MRAGGEEALDADLILPDLAVGQRGGNLGVVIDGPLRIAKEGGVEDVHGLDDEGLLDGGVVGFHLDGQRMLEGAGDGVLEGKARDGLVHAQGGRGAADGGGGQGRGGGGAGGGLGGRAGGIDAGEFLDAADHRGGGGIEGVGAVGACDDCAGHEGLVEALRASGAVIGRQRGLTAGQGQRHGGSQKGVGNHAAGGADAGGWMVVHVRTSKEWADLAADYRRIRRRVHFGAPANLHYRRARALTVHRVLCEMATRRGFQGG